MSAKPLTEKTPGVLLASGFVLTVGIGLYGLTRFVGGCIRLLVWILTNLFTLFAFLTIEARKNVTYIKWVVIVGAALYFWADYAPILKSLFSKMAAAAKGDHGGGGDDHGHGDGHH